MYARSYFAERYFALRYFPELIEVPPAVVGVIPICNLNVAAHVGTIGATVANGSLNAQGRTGQLSALFKCTGRVVITVPPGLPDDYVAFWNFDDFDGITALDQSANNYHATVSGSGPAPTSVAGKVNQGIQFFGSDSGDAKYLNAGRCPALENQPRQSWSYWFKRNADGTPSPLLQINKGRAHGNFIELICDGDFVYACFNATTFNQPYYVIPSPDTAFHHVVWIYDGTQGNNADRIVLYIDGVMQSLSGGEPLGTTTASTTDDLYIGGDLVDAFGIESNDALDQMRVYNRVLTPDEIAALYAEV